MRKVLIGILIIVLIGLVIFGIFNKSRENIEVLSVLPSDFMTIGYFDFAKIKTALNNNILVKEVKTTNTVKKMKNQINKSLTEKTGIDYKGALKYFNNKGAYLVKKIQYQGVSKIQGLSALFVADIRDTKEEFKSYFENNILKKMVDKGYISLEIQKADKYSLKKIKIINKKVNTQGLDQVYYTFKRNLFIIGPDSNLIVNTLNSINTEDKNKLKDYIDKEDFKLFENKTVSFAVNYERYFDSILEPLGMQAMFINVFLEGIGLKDLDYAITSADILNNDIKVEQVVKVKSVSKGITKFLNIKNKEKESLFFIPEDALFYNSFGIPNVKNAYNQIMDLVNLAVPEKAKLFKAKIKEMESIHNISFENDILNNLEGEAFIFIPNLERENLSRENFPLAIGIKYKNKQKAEQLKQLLIDFMKIPSIKEEGYKINNWEISTLSLEKNNKILSIGINNEFIVFSQKEEVLFELSNTEGNKKKNLLDNKLFARTYRARKDNYSLMFTDLKRVAKAYQIPAQMISHSKNSKNKVYSYTDILLGKGMIQPIKNIYKRITGIKENYYSNIYKNNVQANCKNLMGSIYLYKIDKQGIVPEKLKDLIPVYMAAMPVFPGGYKVLYTASTDKKNFILEVKDEKGNRVFYADSSQQAHIRSN